MTSNQNDTEKTATPMDNKPKDDSADKKQEDKDKTAKDSK